MNRTTSFLKWILVLMLPIISTAQTKTMDYPTFIQIVREHHPIMTQAEIKALEGEAYLLKAKGGFDPKVLADIRQKQFEEKEYYSYINAGLKVPTWFGITLQGGFDSNRGQYLGNESTTPMDGLLHAGITANLGSGLFIDERRAELKQAKIYLESTQLEQRLMENQLIFDASTAYWEWYKAYNKLQIYDAAVANATLRFEAIKNSALFGDRPSIDTLEAFIQVQNRQVKREQSRLDFENKQSQLNVFLWQDGYIPLELDSTMAAPLYTNLVPSTPDVVTFLDMESLVNNHPEMQIARNKIDIAKIDYRLSKEQLKPTLEVKYNALSAATSADLENYSINNYAWGAQFSYPIFTRKERGNVKLSELKIQDQEAEVAQKGATIRYKLTFAKNNWLSSYEQVLIYTSAVQNYETMLAAELELFFLGESSIFMVNSRDKSTIDAQIELVEIQFLNQLSKHFVDYQLVR